LCRSHRRPQAAQLPSCRPPRQWLAAGLAVLADGKSSSRPRRSHFLLVRDSMVIESRRSCGQQQWTNVPGTIVRKSQDRLLPTHTGSLPRPESLLRSRGPSSGEALDSDEGVIKAAVNEVVQRQARCGIDVASDGECGKASFVGYVRERLEGLGSI